MRCMILLSKKLFKISKPYGYHIPQVDETIARYNKALVLVFYILQYEWIKLYME